MQRETKYFFPKTISLQQAQNLQKDHLTIKGLMVRKTELQTLTQSRSYCRRI